MLSLFRYLSPEWYISGQYRHCASLTFLHIIGSCFESLLKVYRLFQGHGLSHQWKYETFYCWLFSQNTVWPLMSVQNKVVGSVEEMSKSKYTFIPVLQAVPHLPWYTNRKLSCSHRSLSCLLVLFRKSSNFLFFLSCRAEWTFVFVNLNQLVLCIFVDECFKIMFLIHQNIIQITYKHPNTLEVLYFCQIHLNSTTKRREKVLRKRIHSLSVGGNLTQTRVWVILEQFGWKENRWTLTNKYWTGWWEQ